MTNAAIASYFHKSFYIERNLASEFALNPVIMVDIFSQFGYGVFIQIFNSRVGVYARRRKNFLGRLQTDTVDIGKPYFYSLFSG